MATPQDKSNRIHVDLQILQDANLERLQKFSLDFDQSVKALITAVGDLKTAVQQESPESGASWASDKRRAQPARIGPGQPFSNIPYNAGVGYEGEASVADTQTPDQIRAQAVNEERRGVVDASMDARDVPIDKNPYLQAQFELGQVGEGPLAMLRYISRATQMAGQKFGSEGLFNAGSHLEDFAKALTIGKGALTGLSSNVAKFTGLPSYTSFMPGAGSIAAQQFGINANLSPQGGPLDFLHNIPLMGGIANLFSPAGFSGVKAEVASTWEGIKSIFGGGSDITTAQAKEIREVLNQYGWGQPGNSGQTDFLRNTLTHYTKKYRGAVTPEDMMSMGYDAAVRFGTSSLTDLNRTLDNMSTAANAANMGLKEFKDSLIVGAQELSQATGAPMSAAMIGLEGASAATGLDPKVVSSIASNRRNLLLGLAMTHTPLWKLEEGKVTPAILGLKGAMGYLGPGLGDPKTWKAAEKAAAAGDPTQLHNLQSMLQMRYIIDPQVFGGLTPKAIENEMLRGGPHKNILNEAQAGVRLMRADTHKGMVTAMHEAGVGPKKMKEFAQWRSEHHIGEKLQEAFKKHDTRATAKLVNQERQEALKLLGKSEKKTAAKTASKTAYTIGLNAQAAKFLTLMEQKSGGKPHTNSLFDNYGRPALAPNVHGGFLGDTMHQLEGNK